MVIGFGLLITVDELLGGSVAPAPDPVPDPEPPPEPEPSAAGFWEIGTERWDVGDEAWNLG